MLRLARLPVRMRLPCCLGGFGATCLVWQDAGGPTGTAGAFFPYWYVGLKESACMDSNICMLLLVVDQYTSIRAKKTNCFAAYIL